MRWMILGMTVACLLGMGTIASASDKPGKTTKNEIWGFKVRYPNKWTVLQMSTKAANTGCPSSGYF